MFMDFQANENSDLVTLNCEELDYEGDDIGFKKGSPVAVEQEEGEITDLEDDDNLENLTCSFFQQGKCDSGNKCPFLHVTDKGLYRMLDSPPSSVVAPITFLNAVPDTNLYVSEPQETAFTDWDQALEEEKKRVQQFDPTAKRTCPVTIPVKSDKDLKLKKKTEFYKLPVSKELSRDCSHSSAFSVTLKQKQLAKENKQPPEITCRRKQKNSSLSSNSRSDSQSPHRWERLSLSERYSRGNENRSSSSRSRSPHRSKKQRLKTKSKTKPIGKKDPQPIISRRSSRSRSPSLLRHFREERSVKNRSSEDRSSVKKRIAVLSSKSSDRQPTTIACRSLKSRSPASARRSREEKIQTKLQSHSVDYKSNRNSKDFTGERTTSLLSNSGQQLKISRPFSSKSHSPAASVGRSKDEKLKMKPSATPEKKSRSLKNKPERDFMQKRIPSSTFSFDRQPRDVGRWTPKKIRPPSSPVRNCSDMSISPLTDSSLSDLFDPDKKTDKPRCYEATQSRLFPPQKMDKTQVYGPACPQEIQSVTLKSSQMKLSPERMFETKYYVAQNKTTNSISGPYWYETTQSRLLPPQKTGKPEVYGPVCTPELRSSSLKSLQTKSSLEAKVTQSKPIGPSTSKRVQKRNVSALECDLLKFHKHRLRVDVSQPAAQQKATKKITQERKCAQRKPLSRKEELLQQLAKINEVIEKKRKMCAKLDNSL